MQRSALSKDGKDQWLIQGIGEGNFICDKGPGDPVIVVEYWVPDEDAWRCRRCQR